MPHLQFEIKRKVDPEVKEKFIKSVLKIFGDVMQTDTSHVAVSLREHDDGNLSLGRTNYQDPICLMNLVYVLVLIHLFVSSYSRPLL